MEKRENELLQDTIDRTLSRGMMFAFLWMGGIGSFIAIWSGVRAKNLIKSSTTPLKGSRKANWCIGLGSVGVSIIAFGIVWGILNNYGVLDYSKPLPPIPHETIANPSTLLLNDFI